MDKAAAGPPDKASSRPLRRYSAGDSSERGTQADSAGPDPQMNITAHFRTSAALVHLIFLLFPINWLGISSRPMRIAHSARKINPICSFSTIFGEYKRFFALAFYWLTESRPEVAALLFSRGFKLLFSGCLDK